LPITRLARDRTPISTSPADFPHRVPTDEFVTVLRIGRSEVQGRRRRVLAPTTGFRVFVQIDAVLPKRSASPDHGDVAFPVRGPEQDPVVPVRSFPMEDRLLYGVVVRHPVAAEARLDDHLRGLRLVHPWAEVSDHYFVFGTRDRHNGSQQADDTGEPGPARHVAFWATAVPRGRGHLPPLAASWS